MESYAKMMEKLDRRISDLEEELYGGGKTPAERRQLMDQWDKLRAEYIDMRNLNLRYSGIRA